MEQLLLQRIMKAPPIKEYITPGSTPVVAFGNPITARVATIGINPSSREFLDAKGKLLSEESRRLADFQSLGIKSHAEINESVAKSVLEESNSYFKRDESVYKWFEPMQDYVLNTVKASFRDSTAAHLDLVQWSTAPVWGAIKDAKARNLLIQDDIRFLGELLRSASYKVVFMNGSTVVKALEKFGLVEIEQDGWTPLGKGTKKSSLWKGRVIGSDAFCLGWSLNLQHYQTTDANRLAIRDWISRSIRLQ
jgi:hypothetical protein